MRTPDILVNRDLLRRIGRFLFSRPLAWAAKIIGRHVNPFSFSRPLAWAAKIIGRHVNPWERQPATVPTDYFGLEEGQSLKQYFEPPSAVQVSNLDEVLAFLLSCQYVPVGEGLGQQDRWMRPHDVEWCRVGDCKALALWAWRRLVELGHDAELVCGEWSPPTGQPGLHAFVVFREGPREYLLEATARSESAMVRPLAIARADYTPAYSVDASLQTYTYHGCLRLIPRHSRRAA